jgi:hypothetical protein
MQWTIELEFTPDGGGTISHEIGKITRPIADLKPEEIGLTLAEGHELYCQLNPSMVRLLHSNRRAERMCDH